MQNWQKEEIALAILQAYKDNKGFPELYRKYGRHNVAPIESELIGMRFINHDVEITSLGEKSLQKGWVFTPSWTQERDKEKRKEEREERKIQQADEANRIAMGAMIISLFALLFSVITLGLHAVDSIDKYKIRTDNQKHYRNEETIDTIKVIKN